MKRSVLTLVLLAAGTSFGQSTINGLANQTTPTITVTAGETNATSPAVSAYAVNLDGTVQAGGTSTTSFPYMIFQPSGTTAVTTWSSTGTQLGMNAVSGFTGNFLDFHIAGGSSLFSVQSTGTTTFGTAPTVTTPGTGWYLFGTDGSEPASIASGTSGFVMDSSLGTAVLWENAVNAGAVDAEWANNSTNLLTSTPSTITSTTMVTTTLAFPAVPANKNVIGHCDIYWKQATAAGGVTFGLNTSAAPTNLIASSTNYSTTSSVVNFLPVSITTATTTSISASLTPTFNTLYHFHIDAALINSSSAETVTVYVDTQSGSDAITINQGSSCSWNP